MSTKQQGIIKNIRVSQRYGVSRPTVGKWVENAQQGRNNLQLTEKDGRKYIIDNKHNAAEIARLKEHGVKYRNKIAYESVVPSNEFYKIFNRDQIIDITSTLEFNSEIPIKYTYLNGGADLWNNFIQDNLKNYPHYIERSTALIKSNTPYLVYLLSSYEKINIIDLGPGEGTPVLQVIPEFLKAGTKVTYTAADISQRMIEIVNSKVKKEFPQIDFDPLEIDFENESLQSYLFKKGLEANSCNLIMYLGGNIGVYPDKVEHLGNIQKAMGQNDYLVVDNAIDEVTSRTSFKSFDNQNFLRQFTWLAGELGLSSDMYEREFYYNAETNFRSFDIKLNKDVDIAVDIDGSQKIIKFKEGEKINVWRHSSWKSEQFMNDFYTAGFNVFHFSINQEVDTGIVVGKRAKRSE